MSKVFDKLCAYVCEAMLIGVPALALVKAIKFIIQES